jgi:hypothetical protein
MLYFLSLILSFSVIAQEATVPRLDKEEFKALVASDLSGGGYKFADYKEKCLFREYDEYDEKRGQGRGIHYCDRNGPEMRETLTFEDELIKSHYFKFDIHDLAIFEFNRQGELTQVVFPHPTKNCDFFLVNFHNKEVGEPSYRRSQENKKRKMASFEKVSIVFERVKAFLSKLGNDHSDGQALYVLKEIEESGCFVE